MSHVHTVSTQDRHLVALDGALPPGASRERRPSAGRPARADLAVSPLRHASGCGCVETSVFAYPDEDGDLSCARCGRLLVAAAAA